MISEPRLKPDKILNLERLRVRLHKVGYCDEYVINVVIKVTPKTIVI